MTWGKKIVLGNTKHWRFFFSQPHSSSCCLTTGLLSHWCCFPIKYEMIPEFLGKFFPSPCRPGQGCTLSRTLHIWLLPCAALRLGASVESLDSFWSLERGGGCRHSAGPSAGQGGLPAVALVWQRWEKRALRPSTQPGSLVFNVMVQVTSCSCLIAGQPSVLFYALKNARSIMASVYVLGYA